MLTEATGGDVDKAMQVCCCCLLLLLRRDGTERFLPSHCARPLSHAPTHTPYTWQVLLLSKYWTTQAGLASSENAKVLFYPSKATVPVSVEGLREMLGNE